MSVVPDTACCTCSTVSPLSRLAVLVPVRVVSTKAIQPCSQSPVLAHAVPVLLLHTVTRVPRRMASDRARFKALTSSLVLLVSWLEAISPWKLGTAMARRMAITDKVTNNSTKVNPRAPDF